MGGEQQRALLPWQGWQRERSECWQSPVPAPVPAHVWGRGAMAPACKHPDPDFFSALFKRSHAGSSAHHSLWQHCWNSLPLLRSSALLAWAAKPGREGMLLCRRAVVRLPCLETPAPWHCPSALPADLLQVLLSLLLALAALHGGPASPPPADAQPEEQRLQLKRPPRLGGRRRRRRKSFC